MRAAIARERADPVILCRRVYKLCRDRGIGGRQVASTKHRVGHASSRLISPAQRIVERTCDAGGAHGCIDTAKRAARNACAPAGRITSAEGDVIDDAAYRVRPMQGTLLAPQHLDACNLIRNERGVVEFSKERIARFDPVDKRQSVIALGAAYPN